MPIKSLISFWVVVFVLLGAASRADAGLHPSYSDKGVVDTVPFYIGGQYDRTVPHPNEFLAQPLGQWPMNYHEMVTAITAVAESSDRVILRTRGRTHEGRDLFNVFISSRQNIGKLEQYRTLMDNVADPRQMTTDAELEAAIAELPAFCWLGYTIHGDELSGSDAAVLLTYHLAAANDSATRHLLDNLIIIIDPLQNPDGHERYVHMLQQFRSQVPNYDAGALQHEGVWPWGRGNHYLFDLNRDCILVTQPETVGKLQTIQEYHPVLTVDAHEMGPDETYLLSPPREPINYSTPPNVLKWYGVFKEDQASAFDQRGWPYYSGEWNEQWYPGYTSAWPTFSGAVGILYEQAGVGGGVVKQPGDYLLTYHESVNHQFTSSLANLHTAANNRPELLRDYHLARMQILEQGRQSRLTFLFVPDDDEVKMKRFIESLIYQGIEVRRATGEFAVAKATDAYRYEHAQKRLPAGTYIVSTAQPTGALATAVLDFDPHLNLEFLKEERRELEKHNETRMYEVGSWSLPLAYDVEAYYTTSSLDVETKPVVTVQLSGGELINAQARFGFLADMVGEKTYRLLNRLFGEELIVYASEKSFTVEGRSYRPGSLLLRRRGNPEELPDLLAPLAAEIGINVYGVNTGRSDEGSDLGAPTFRLLVQPRVAVITGDGINFGSVGSLWFTIDQELGIPHSLIQSTRLSRADLTKYNVVILPAAWGDGLHSIVGKRGAKKLQEWVEDGGTLVITGQSAVWAADTSVGLSQVRQKRQVLDQLSMYRKKMERELQAEGPEVDTIAIWHPDRVPIQQTPAEEKTDAQASGKADGKEAEELDRWLRRFHPRGTILRADIDTEDWLAFGMRDKVPVIAWSSHALMASSPVKTVARFTPDENNLRLSGLLWPEARQRWAGTAFITRETKGKGQIIMVAGPAYLRAYFWGTRKMFVNAILYGPGMRGHMEPYE